jgi:exopolysaccharide biosynthesis polyprenyl glycosylphosphotransferase
MTGMGVIRSVERQVRKLTSGPQHPDGPRKSGAAASQNGHGPAAASPFPGRERSADDARAGDPLPARLAAAKPDPFEALVQVVAAPRGERDDVAPPFEQGDALRDVRKREKIYRRLLALSDALVAALAVFVAIDVLGGSTVRPLYLLVMPLIVLAAKTLGLYDKDELVIDHSTLAELPRLLNLATIFALLVWLARHFVVIGAPATVTLLQLWVLLCAGLVIGRSAARELARRITPAERCMLVGSRQVFSRLDVKFRGHRHLKLVGAVHAAQIASEPARLREIAEYGRVHRIIIDTDATSGSNTLDLVRAANATGLQVSLLPSMLDAVGGSVVFDDIGGLMLMGVPRFGLGRSSLALKRAFDVITASVVLVVGAPVLIAIATAVKLDARGPILFRQTRVGRDEKPFEMLKFRSMIDGADALKESLRHANEADGLFKIRNDPRITRVGRVLRRTGLDELPQLFNVLAGNMSLVGPRPLVVDEDRRVTGFDRRRLHLTPGITGRWQTLGGARVPLAEMVKIDYLYITNWSLWLDLKIMVETIGFLARRGGQ